MSFFDHKDLGNRLLQYCPQVVKHLVYIYIYMYIYIYIPMFVCVCVCVWLVSVSEEKYPLLSELF